MIHDFLSYSHDVSAVITETIDTNAVINGTAPVIIWGMSLKDWITIAISIAGIIVTILGLFIAIKKLRIDIKYEKEKLHIQKRTILSEESKNYYAELLQLFVKLINAINLASAYSETYYNMFSIDPSESKNNNLFKGYIVHGDEQTSKQIEVYRKEIIIVYEDICALNKNAPVHNDTIDLRMLELVTHMLQALVIEKNRHLIDHYHKICTAQFPKILELNILQKDIKMMLFSN